MPYQRVRPLMIATFRAARLRRALGQRAEVKSLRFPDARLHAQTLAKVKAACRPVLALVGGQGLWVQARTKHMDASLQC
eukprot:12763388-Alexandrium_andersonii.AAC.1